MGSEPLNLRGEEFYIAFNGLAPIGKGRQKKCLQSHIYSYKEQEVVLDSLTRQSSIGLC